MPVSRACIQIKINFLGRSNCLCQRNRISPRFVYDVGTFNFTIQKLCTLQTSLCTITRDTIERNEIGGAIVEARVFVFGSYILHAIRTQCGPSEAVVYYFRYLTAARLPACFPPSFSVPTRNSDVSVYIYSVL